MSDVNGTSSADGDTAAAVKQTAKEKAGEGAGLVGEKVTDVAGTTQERAGDVAGEAASQVQNVAGELRDQLQGHAQTQTRRLAESVRQLSNELGTMGEKGEPGSPATKAVRHVAERGHGMAEKLEARGPQGIASDLQDFARRRPGVFLAGAAIAGFATARLAKGLKSSSSAGTRAGTGGRQSSDGRDGGPAATTVGQTSATTAPSGSGVQTQPTPSYGGSVSPSAPLPVTDPYPNPDPRQP